MLEQEPLKSLALNSEYKIHREFIGYSKKYDHHIDIFELEDNHHQFIKIIDFI